MNAMRILGLHILLVFPTASSWWPFPSDKNEPEPTTIVPLTGPTSKNAIFEMKTADEKFLSEAETFLQLPALDGCLHRTVAMLKKSCSEIGEEDLAKFSVLLLNCQSQAEGRSTHECTEEMSVAECTQGMDPHTWNAYHIISNRARSVCYATRQQQFRMKTELVVNQLASSAEEQINTMSELKDGQEEIGRTATETLGMMSEGQRILIGQQTRLKQSQSEISRTVTSNLRRLTQEKDLIQSGQQQLAEMTDDIRRRLENATEQLENQDTNRQQNHQQLMSDLTQLRLKAKEVWDKIDKNTEEIVQQHSMTLIQYKEMLENFQRLNATINNVLGLVNQVDSQINWVAVQLGGDSANIKTVVICVQHACFLMMAMTCVVFLNAPWLTRLGLVLIVPSNAMAQLKNVQYQMDFRTMTITLAVTLICDLLLQWILQRRKKNGFYPVSSNPPALEEIQMISHGYTSLPPSDNDPGSRNPATPLESIKVTPSTSKSGRDSRCQAVTKAGLPCRLAKTLGSPYCKTHFKKAE